MTLDDDLRTAAEELRDELTAVTAPQFRPPSPGPSRALVATTAVLLAAGGWWGLRQLSDEPATSLQSASGDTIAPSSTAPGQPDSVPTPIPTTTSDASAADTTDSNGATDSTGASSVGPLTGSRGVGGLDEVATSPMERPGSAGLIEPDFATLIRRLSESLPGEVTLPVYSRTQSFNADGSLIMLYRTQGERISHVLYDAATLSEIGPVDMDAFDIEDFYWDRSDPNVVHYVGRGTNQLLEVNVRTGATSSGVVFDGCDTVDPGDTSGSSNSGSDLLALICRRAGLGDQVVAVDLATGVELARVDATSPSAPIAMRSGNGFVAFDGDEIRVLDRELVPTGPDLVYRGDVASAVTAMDGAGNDLLVATLFSDPVASGLAVAFDLATGERIDLVSEATGHGYPVASSQLSVAGGPLGSLVVGSSNRGQGSDLLVDEIVVIDLADPDTPVRRLAHHRMSEPGRFGAWDAVYTAISPDGARVLFSSDWGTGEAVDTYVIELP